MTYSFAVKATYRCMHRTYAFTTWSNYGLDGSFISTQTGAGLPTDIVPDTEGETILKMVCAADFPHNTSNTVYGPVLNNDPKTATAKLYEYLHAKKNDPAPQ